MYQKRILLLRRHPAISIIVFVCFAVSLMLVIALKLNGFAFSSGRRKLKVNTYLLPADYGLECEVAEVAAFGKSSPDTQDLIPATEAVIDRRIDLLFKAVPLAIAVFVGLAIALMMTRLLIS